MKQSRMVLNICEAIPVPVPCPGTPPPALRRPGPPDSMVTPPKRRRLRHTCHAEVLPGPAISYGIDFKVKGFPDDRDLSDAGSDGLHEHFVECSGGAIDARVVQPGGGPMAYISPSLEGAAAVCTADDIHLVHSGHT